jgi:MFS family permease
VESDRLMSRAMMVVAAVIFMGAMVPNLFVLAPRYLAERGHDEQQIGFIMGGFSIASLLTMPVAGRVSDLLGHRLVMIVGCAIAAAGSLLFEHADQTVTFTLARATQGMGFACVLVSGSSYVAEIAPPRRLAQALGLAGMLALCSQAAGPLVGELIEEAAGWPWVFRGGAIGGGSGAVLAVFIVPTATRRGGSDGAVSALPILVATALASFGFGAVWVFIADYVGRVGIGTVTPFFVPYVVAAIAVRIFAGHLADRWGRRAVAVPALLLHGSALLAMAHLGNGWQLAAIGAMFGVAHGFYYPALQALVVERSAGARSRAVAASTSAFGFGIVSAAFGLGPVARLVDYPAIYLISAATGGLAAALVWRLGVEESPSQPG